MMLLLRLSVITSELDDVLGMTMSVWGSQARACVVVC